MMQGGVSTSVPFATLPPDGRIAYAYYRSRFQLRIVFKSDVVVDPGATCNGIYLYDPCGGYATGFVVTASGPDWIDIFQLGYFYNRVSVWFTPPDIHSPSGNWKLGQSKLAKNTVPVYIESVDFLPTPHQIHITFDSFVVTYGAPHIFEARAGSGPWRQLTSVISRTGRVVRYNWTWDYPMPDQFRVLTYPCGYSFGTGFLVIPQYIPVTPPPPGVFDSVDSTGLNAVNWYVENEDLLSVSSPPPALEVYHSSTGWISPDFVLDWDEDNLWLMYSLGGMIPTEYRVQTQPTELTFGTGPMEIPQSGSVT